MSYGPSRNPRRPYARSVMVTMTGDPELVPAAKDATGRLSAALAGLDDGS